jgi:hypothetical protein
MTTLAVFRPKLGATLVGHLFAFDTAVYGDDPNQSETDGTEHGYFFSHEYFHKICFLELG